MPPCVPKLLELCSLGAVSIPCAHHPLFQISSFNLPLELQPFPGSQRSELPLQTPCEYSAELQSRVRSKVTSPRGFVPQNEQHSLPWTSLLKQQSQSPAISSLCSHSVLPVPSPAFHIPNSGFKQQLQKFLHLISYNQNKLSHPKTRGWFFYLLKCSGSGLSCLSQCS